MKILYKDEKVETDNLINLGENSEGTVYKYQDSALKVYHDRPAHMKFLLTEDICKHFTQIKTKRILMSTDLVFAYDANNQPYYRGGRSKLVDKPVSLVEMWETLDSDSLKREDQILREDLNILTENKIVLSDLSTSGNFMYNQDKQMYFVDYGDYSIGTNYTIEQTNLQEFNEACHTHLFLLAHDQEALEQEFSKIVSDDFSFAKKFFEFIRIVYNDIYEQEFSLSFEDYLVFLQYILDDYQTIENYKRELLASAIDNGFYDYEYPEELEELERVLRR